MAIPTPEIISADNGDLVQKIVDATAKNHTSSNDRFMSSQLRASEKHIKAILEGCKVEGITDLGQIAYILGTVRRESLMGNWMIERIPEEKANANYGGRFGNDNPGDGYKYRGRGYVQITFKANYEKFGKLLGLDLVANPDDAMDPATAAKICIVGMRDGTFSYKGTLSDFIGGSKRDFLNARNTVNPAELIRAPQKAKLIVAYAESYYTALGG
ncbi:MAG: glycoside hydrolase family 19 protein [Spirochaetota bacterium]